MLSAQINELVTLAKNGNAEAFGELYEIYYKEMYYYACCVTGNESLAQDAVSDAVLSAFRQIGSLRKPSAFKGWLFKILCAACKRYYTENEKKKSVIWLDDKNSGFDNATATDDLNVSVELQTALQKLSEQEREIVLLSVIGNYKSHEIAEILDCPSATVRSRLRRSLEKLRGYMDENG